ncbi:hypothetical protein [Paractinoplanes brasiliensis]|uniref:Uncharacterized protein n=1 Tax=Paractinoplanes brasiliensis TaxID=52695 RepID=A0A4R6K211_9ACTN|nr:hypothetical protein [Actinoplanes brasiliensis]TDO42171.1 hypothetical protein C8E87_5936 [Actinoplanes brasiliensis]GID31962.1 hypothetical protein Abr02nite_69450 [Actinoplanes brasiliensis]
MEPSSDVGLSAEPKAPSPTRPFWIGTAVYVLIVLGMLTLSQLTDESAVLFVGAELATLPIGIGWFTGGLFIVAAVGSELGWAGVPLLYGAFATAAVINAVVLREVFRFFHQRCRYRNRPGLQRS